MAGDLKDVRVILCCAGTQTRWKNYLGVPKHLAPVHGVPLLHRTVGQLRSRGFEDIVITAFESLYVVPGAQTRVPMCTILPDTGTGHSAEFWSETGRTIVLYGDDYFTRHAMDVIAACPPEGLLWFGRYGPGKAQHCGELFGYSLPLDMQVTFKFAVRKALEAKACGETPRACSWEVYRFLHGIPMGDHKVAGDWIEIDDATDDFDTPEDYERWVRLFAEAEKGEAP